MPLTAERVRELFDLDKGSGMLIWKKTGVVGGYVTRDGYRDITVDGRAYRAHRLVWLYVTGDWPVGQIDHINGVRADNRYVNLRDVSQMQNAKNMKRPVSNTSGFKGVSWHKRSGKWQAVIACNKKQNHLGLFLTPEDAYAAYCEAALRLHGEFACFG